MDTKERNKQIKSALVEYTKKITVSAETARDALVKEGIYTKTGRLTKHYSQGETAKR